MDVNFQPLFLKNSPSLICDQILYLVKNSNINFDLHETPFSLKLNLKKSFAQHWNKPDYTAQNNLPSQPPFPQQDSDLVHQQHHVSVGQPESQTLKNLYHHVSKQQQQNASVHQYHQYQPHVPQQQPHKPHHVPVHHHSAELSQQVKKDLEIHKQIEVLKAEHVKIVEENCKYYAELDKANRKLSKEHKELQAKHMKDCSEVKVLKDYKKEISMKEGNALSVALKSCKKDLDLTLKTSGKEIEALKEELATLKEFKIQ